MSAALEVAACLDPAVIMRASGMEPDPWQDDILQDTDDFWLLLCSRQSGKTTACAALALATALRGPSALVLIVAPSLRQSQEAFRSVANLYLGLFGGVLPEDSLTAMRLELANRSRVICVPADDDARIRGFTSVKLIVADEGARIADRIYHALLPTLAASNGRLVIASTPWFERGFMHEQWTADSADWRHVRVTARECPRIDPGFLERERRSKPDYWYRQEYEAEWGAAGESLFPWPMLEAISDPSVELYSPARLRFV